jgi:hypothetical protein
VKKLIVILIALLVGCTSSPPTDDHISGFKRRSHTAIAHFKKAHPCPANGNDHGPCPGYVIDHIKPLDCGGDDDPSNMQWQTIEEGKAKDKWERKQLGCPGFLK